VQHPPKGQRLLSPAEVARPRHFGCAIVPQSQRTDAREAAIDSSADFSRQAKPQQEAITSGKVGGGEDSTVAEDRQRRFRVRRALRLG
jgi:hypothetical protein